MTPPVRRRETIGEPAAVDVVWQSAEVLEAAARRPGIDLALLRDQVDDWLVHRAHKQQGHSVGLALSFIDRWRPPAESPAASTQVRSSSAAADFEWATEAVGAIKAQQEALLAAVAS